jgi:hypothetical protein
MHGIQLVRALMPTRVENCVRDAIADERLFSCEERAGELQAEWNRLVKRGLEDYAESIRRQVESA